MLAEITTALIKATDIGRTFQHCSIQHVQKAPKEGTGKTIMQSAVCHLKQMPLTPTGSPDRFKRVTYQARNMWGGAGGCHSCPWDTCCQNLAWYISAKINWQESCLDFLVKSYNQQECRTCHRYANL